MTIMTTVLSVHRKCRQRRTALRPSVHYHGYANGQDNDDDEYRGDEGGDDNDYAHGPSLRSTCIQRRNREIVNS